MKYLAPERESGERSFWRQQLSVSYGGKEVSRGLHNQRQEGMNGWVTDVGDCQNHIDLSPSFIVKLLLILYMSHIADIHLPYFQSTALISSTAELKPHVNRGQFS